MVLNIFLNHCFVFDSVGVMFDRSISVCCDTSLREGGCEGTHLYGRGFGLLLVFCGLLMLKSHPSYTYKLLEPPVVDSGRVVYRGSSSVLICAKGLLLVMSSAKLSITEQKVAPQVCDAVTLMWGQFSAGAVPPGSE